VINGIKGIFGCTAIVLFSSMVHFVCAYTIYPPTPGRETSPGEGFGEVGLWALLFIYARSMPGSSQGS